MTRFAYDAQLAAIPGVVAELVSASDYPVLAQDRPLLFVGIGTSLHAARVAVDWVAQLTGGRIRAFAVDAHDLGTGAYPLTTRDQVVVISHRGTKVYPNAALDRAASLGCDTVAVVGSDAPDQRAAWTVRTCANETAGTFSVSYLASLAALAKIVAATFAQCAGRFGAALGDLPEALSATLARPIDERWVSRLSARSPMLVSGFGTDLPTAQEAALKIKEGAWLWTEAMSPEFALHGTPASFHSSMSAIVMLPAQDDGGRSERLVATLRSLGVEAVATCGVHGADLAFEAPPEPLLRPFLAIVPFHRLTAELARLRGTDPDTLHGHREPWKTVMTGLRL